MLSNTFDSELQYYNVTIYKSIINSDLLYFFISWSICSHYPLIMKVSYNVPIPPISVWTDSLPNTDYHSYNSHHSYSFYSYSITTSFYWFLLFSSICLYTTDSVFLYSSIHSILSESIDSYSSISISTIPTY